MAIHPNNDQTLNKLFAGGVIAACQKPALKFAPIYLFKHKTKFLP
jgi:hypothetical protein